MNDSKPRILLVDDEPLVLKGLRRNLTGQPFGVDTEDVPENALRRIRAESYDVILSDQDMPGMTGLDLLRRVRDHDSTIICFLLTGKATLEVAMEALNDGLVDRFFTKPCNHVELGVAIQRAIERRQLLEDARRLLWKTRKQSAWIEELERTHPDLTQLTRDECGAIVLDDVPLDTEAFQREVERELGTHRDEAA